MYALFVTMKNYENDDSHNDYHQDVDDDIGLVIHTPYAIYKSFDCDVPNDGNNDESHNDYDQDDDDDN